MANGRKAADLFATGGNGSALRSQSRSEPLPAQRLYSEPQTFDCVPDMEPSQTVLEAPEKVAAMRIVHHAIHIQTREHLQFIDLTDPITEFIRKWEIIDGFVNIQTRHTTTAIIVNEHEPLLLEDMKKLLERIAPQDHEYQHDNFAIRTANLCPEERENGHSHCRAMLLGTSETLNILDGRIQLGRWQRIFFVELDGSRARTVSITIVGA